MYRNPVMCSVGELRFLDVDRGGGVSRLQIFLMMMQECLLLPSALRESINQCAKAHRRIQSIQLRLLKTFANKQHSQNMEKLPFIVSLSLFSICLKKLNPYQVEPARSDRSLCQRKSKKDPCVFEGNKIEKGHLRIGSLNEELDTFSWFVHLEVNVCPISFFKKLILGFSVLACPNKNLALLRRIRGPQQD